MPFLHEICDEVHDQAWLNLRLKGELAMKQKNGSQPDEKRCTVIV
jgi:hypothetical protein